jgi:proteasome alpha subunit
MSMPFYVSPEQLMKDRADFARKGIARGRSVVAIQYADGILFVSENPSQALHKVSEIYDRIAFAAVGRYNEFENLRIAGVRLADMRGYAYDRRDVTGRGLANAYAQTLGTIFSSGGDKPYEVEIFVAEIGDEAADDQLYRLTYDGQVADEHGYAVMGGAADVVAGQLAERYVAGASLEEALRVAVAALGHGESEDRVIPASDLEVAVLDRTRAQPRKFLRLRETRLVRILGDRGTEEAATPAPEDALAGSGPHQSGQDDPADPTDQVSGAVPPLENPVTGEPPVAPPISPPIAPPVAPPTRPAGPGPVDPVAPGEPQPPAPQPPVEPPPGPGHPGHPPVDPAEPGDQQP